MRYKGLGLAALALLTACASGPPQKTAQDVALERYQSYAGPPLPYFTWLGRFYSWEPLGKDHLVVFTTSFDAYLLKVWPPCDMRFVVNAIGVTSTSSTVSARLDSVIAGRQRCPIDEIRRIDYRRMRAEMHQAPNPAAPAAGAQSPPPGAPPPPPPPQ